MKPKFAFSILFLFFFLFLARGDWLPKDIRLDTGNPPGSHSSGYVQICNIGDKIYAVWSESSNFGSDIYFSYSNDGGTIWQNPVRIDTKSTSGSHQSWESKISVNGSYVYVVWRDWRNGLGDIYFNSSSDGGATWQASDVRLDTGDSPGSHISGHPELSSNGANVYVTWNDDRNDGPDIYFNYSTDGGITWQVPFSIDTKATPGATASEWPQICSSGSNVYVSWQEARINGYTAKFIFFNYSKDGGATWQNSDIQLDTGGLPEEHWSTGVDICCNGNTVYAVWEDGRNGESDIYYNYSTDGGITWETSSIRIDTGDLPGARDSHGPHFSNSGSIVYVVWMDERDNQYTSDIYFSGSKDGGLNWQQPVRLDTGDTPGANDSYDPQICCSGNNVYVAWFDERNGEYDIFFNCSTDAGITWNTPDVRLDTGDIPGANESTNPQISSSENTVYVVWSDRRNGETDIYFNSNISSTLLLTISATKGGTVRPKPGEYTHMPRSKVKIEAFPNKGYKFSHWSGDVEGSENPIKFTMDSDKTIKAHFIKQHTLALRSQKGGTTSPSPGSHTFDHGTEVTITAIPESNFRFSNWTGDVLSTENPLIIEMNSNMSITANFVRQYNLTLDAGTGGTTNPPPGTYPYDKGSKATVTAAPYVHHRFSQWTGDLSRTSNPTAINMNRDKFITANFSRIIYAPLNFSGQKVSNRSLTQVEYINVLTWQPHPNNVNISKHRICSIEGEMQSLLVELPANTHQYLHRQVEKDKTYTYILVAVNNEGRDGDPAQISVR